MIELYKGETQRPVEFTSGLDILGETLIATAYDDQGNSYELNSDGITSEGKAPFEKTIMFLKSPTTMPIGQYFVKIYTDRVVVSKDTLLHFGDNPYDIS